MGNWFLRTSIWKVIHASILWEELGWWILDIKWEKTYKYYSEVALILHYFRHSTKNCFMPWIIKWEKCWLKHALVVYSLKESHHLVWTTCGTQLECKEKSSNQQPQRTATIMQNHMLRTSTYGASFIHSGVCGFGMLLLIGTDKKER